VPRFCADCKVSALEFLHFRWARALNRSLSDRTADQMYGLAPVKVSTRFAPEWLTIRPELPGTALGQIACGHVNRRLPAAYARGNPL
jgi:hypothetical protein